MAYSGNRCPSPHGAVASHRQTAVLTDEKGGYIDVPASEIKLMGKDYPLYTVDGGVKCFVVEAVSKQEWLKDYYMNKLIYWLNQQSFFPLRIEEYDKEGKLAFVNVRIGTRANPALGDHGYAVLFDLWWGIPLDLLSASIRGILPRSWSEEDKRIFFSPGFMRREWFLEPPKSLMVLNSPGEFYLRPALEKGKFPRERKIGRDGWYFEAMQSSLPAAGDSPPGHLGTLVLPRTVLRR